MAVPPTGSCTWNCPFKRKWLSHVANFDVTTASYSRYITTVRRISIKILWCLQHCIARTERRCLLAQANDFNLQTTEKYRKWKRSHVVFFFFNLFSLSVKVNVCYFISYFRWIYDKTQFCNIFPFPPIYFYLIGRSKISLLKIKLRARS